MTKICECGETHWETRDLVDCLERRLTEARKARPRQPGEFLPDQENYIVLYWIGSECFVLRERDLFGPSSGDQDPPPQHPFFWTKRDSAARIARQWLEQRKDVVARVEIATILV